MMNVALDAIEYSVGKFLVSVWDKRKESLYDNGSACTAQQNNPTPECVVNATECYDG